MVGLTSPPLSAPPSLHSHTTSSSLSSYSSHPRSTHPSSIASSSTPGFRDFDDGIGGELGNFEEIGLDDPPSPERIAVVNGRKGVNGYDSNGVNGVGGGAGGPGGRSILGAGSTAYSRKSTSGTIAGPSSNPYPSRSLFGSPPSNMAKGRPILPGLNTKIGTIVGKEQPYLHAPGTNGRSGRRSNSPSSRSRGPSPRRSTPPSPALSAMSLPANHISASSLPSARSNGFAGFKQRPSWQGQRRKTAAELEDEVGDSDEDIPDDAVFWNVPISPRAGIRRNSTQGGGAAAGNSGDGYREALAAGNEKMNTQNNHLNGHSRPPTRGSTIDSYTSSSIPPRSKSWSDAMSELGQDAKELTEALEAHAEAMSSSSNLSSKPLPPPLPRPHTITLPPVQAPHTMIDPLPISKEKERVLSRTRPSWLPPKNPNEEKRHLREYKRMMAAALESERRKKARALAEQERLSRQLEETTHLWHSRILPTFSHTRTLASTRELWWRGIPRSIRGTVWTKAIGNAMLASESTFHVALSSSRQLEQSLKDATTLKTERDRAVFALIRRDVATAVAEFEDTSLSRGFEPHAFEQRLRDVLYAYAWYRRDVGYVHGIHLVASILLLNMNKVDAFIALANMLNTSLPLAFLTGDQVAVTKIYSETLDLLRYKIPRLHAHLVGTLALNPESFLEPLMSTCLTWKLPLEVQ